MGENCKVRERCNTVKKIDKKEEIHHA